VIDAALWVGTIGILGLCLLTLVAFAGDTHSLPEVTTHFRVHYAAGLFLSVIVYAAVRRFRWAAVFAVFALLNAATLAPRFIPREAAPEGAPELKLLLSNVLTSNRDHASLLTLVAREKPDLIALLEVNDRWVTALGPLSAEYAYSRRDSRPDNFGIALFSRLPLTEVKTIYLGPAEVPSIRATLTFGGRPITVLATHPVPPGNPENLFLRDQHLTAIARWSSASPTPALVIGDLNCTPWSPAFGRLLKDGALLDTGRGLTPTWPVKPWWLRIPLDHCLASPSFLVADHHRGPDIGSDHFPIIVTLTLRP
jgi:endonuclease/exonuclease/phosphatase (EEP) superfamily protein YafD